MKKFYYYSIMLIISSCFTQISPQSFSLSFSGDKTGNWEIGISVNSGTPGSVSTKRYLANNDVGNTSASGYLTLDPNDQVCLKVNPPSSNAALDIAYTSVTVVRVEDLSAYNSYAEMGFYNNSTTQQISTSFEDVTNAGYTSDNVQNWSHAFGVLTAGSGSDGTYLVSTSFNFNGAANTEFTLGVSKNTLDPVRTEGKRKIGSNIDIGNVTIWGVLAISEGDNIRLKAKVDGTNKDLTVQYCHISLVKISGGTRDSDPYPYASMLTSTEDPSPISLTAATDNQITGYSDDITDNNYWSFSTSQFSPIGISAGYYRVNYFISYSTSVGEDITFKVLKNGSEISQLTSRRSTSNTDRGSVGGNGIILIETASDQIRITANPDGTTNLSVYQSRLSLSRLEKTSDNVLPVELSSFSTSVTKTGVKLLWRTETEVDNYGFDVERMTPLKPPKGGTSAEWKKIGFVEGHGNSNSPKEYSFVDGDLLRGTVYYRLKQIDTDGSFEYSDIVQVEIGLPTRFELFQNYPNPFNPGTVISYQLAVDSYVTLKVYNIVGREIVTLVNKSQEPGYYNVNFNATNLSSGIYYYSIIAGANKFTRKMILIR